MSDETEKNRMRLIQHSLDFMTTISAESFERFWEVEKHQIRFILDANPEMLRTMMLMNQRAMASFDKAKEKL